MKLPGSIELSDEVINGNGNRVVHFKVQDPNAFVPAIVDLGLIPEINFIKGMLEKMCDGFYLPKNQPIIIAGSDINHLSYIIGLMIGLQNGSISTREYENGNSFHYLGKLNNTSTSNLEIDDDYFDD
jgi:hypothetical protein